MIAIERAAAPDRRPEPISQTYRRLRRAGFAEPEAANLIAVKSGVAVTPQPWNMRELAHLLFLRELGRAEGRWSSADDRADGDRARIPAFETRASAPRVEWDRPEDADPRDGRVTLLTLFRAMAGSDATLDLLHPSSRSPSDAAGNADRKDG